MIKIDLKTVESKEYYDELFYISLYYSRFSKNPKLRIQSYEQTQKMLLLVSIAMIAMVLLDGLSDNYWNIIYLVIFGMLAYGSFKGRNNATKYYQKMKEDFSREQITINGDEITHFYNSEEYKDNMSNIKYVIINKETVVFISKTTPRKLICIPIRYKEEVINYLNEKGYSALIVDNTSKYEK